MKNFKKFGSFLSIVLTLSVVLGNFSLPTVFAYEKNGVTFEQGKAKTTLNNSGANLNKINSISRSANSLSQDSSITQKEKTALKVSTDNSKVNDYVEGEILVKYRNNKINLNTASGRNASLNFIRTKSLEKKEDLRKNNKHGNKHLQRSYNKYGEENFVFEVLEFVEDKNNLLEREQLFSK